jgi:flagellar protein FlgJ
MQISDYTGAAAIEASQSAKTQVSAASIKAQFSEVLKAAEEVAGQPADTVADQKKAAAEKRLYEACQSLESVFINQMLSSMRATIPDNSFIGNSFANETFQGMLFEEYANLMSKTESFGIARVLYNQLSARV